MNNKFTHLGAAMLISVFGLSGCVTVVHPPGEQPPADQLRCYNAPRPDGFIRVNSLDSGLTGCPIDTNFNVFQYTAYVGLPLGSKLEVCSDAWPLPDAQAAGWERWSDPYRDASGCDNRTARFVNDPNYLNVIIIKKTAGP